MGDQLRRDVMVTSRQPQEEGLQGAAAWETCPLLLLLPGLLFHGVEERQHLVDGVDGVTLTTAVKRAPLLFMNCPGRALHCRDLRLKQSMTQRKKSS